MTRYSVEEENAAKSCKTKGSDLRVHFKNTREAAQAIKVSFNSTAFFFEYRELIHAQELIKRFEAYHAGQVRLDKNNPVDQQIGMRLICQWVYHTQHFKL